MRRSAACLQGSLPSRPATHVGSRESSRHPPASPWRWLHRETANHGRAMDRWSSTMRTRSPPVLSWARSWRGHGREPTHTCLSSRRCCLTPWCLASGGRPARWRRRRRSKRRCTGSSASAVRPPHGRSSVRQMRRSSVRMPAEKTPQTLPHTVRARPDKCLMVRGRTCSGHPHASLRVKQEVPPEWDWLADLHRRVDLGYRGIQAAYCGEPLASPPRQPRQRQKPPNPPWSEEQKAAHTVWSRVRLFIEQAMGGLKRSNILVPTCRNRIEHCEDDAIGICAGLWNLVLSY
jgi:hypothetical protein